MNSNVVEITVGLLLGLIAIYYIVAKALEVLL